MKGKQRKKRVHIRTDVFINRILRGEALDLSADGMYIYTRHSYVVDSIIEASFKLGNSEIDVQAKVIHSQPGIGCGVNFMGLKEEVVEKVKDYVEKHGSTEQKG
jgi:hypothetical protein